MTMTHTCSPMGCGMEGANCFETILIKTKQNLEPGEALEGTGNDLLNVTETKAPPDTCSVDQGVPTWLT